MGSNAARMVNVATNAEGELEQLADLYEVDENGMPKLDEKGLPIKKIYGSGGAVAPEQRLLATLGVSVKEVFDPNSLAGSVIAHTGIDPTVTAGEAIQAAQTRISQMNAPDVQSATRIASVLAQATGSTDLRDLSRLGRLVDSPGVKNIESIVERLIEGDTTQKDANDVARSAASLGKLAGNATLSLAGNLSAVATSDDPLRSAGTAAADYVTRGLYSTVSGFADGSKPLTLGSAANVLANFNPITATYNAAASLFKIPTLGEMLNGLTQNGSANDAANEFAIGERGVPQMGTQDDWNVAEQFTGGERRVATLAEAKALGVTGGENYSSGGVFNFTGGGSGGGGCVHVDSILPGGKRAGDVVVGDVLHLCEPVTGEHDSGVVTASHTSQQQCYVIGTESGVWLKCSDSAPIPVKSGGYKTPQDLRGESVPVYIVDSISHEDHSRWDKVTHVIMSGIDSVQNITVGDKCFWAGAFEHSYILHHNIKEAVGMSDHWMDDLSYDM